MRKSCMGRDDSVIFFMNRFQDFNLSREGGGVGRGKEVGWCFIEIYIYRERGLGACNNMLPPAKF